MDQRRNGESYQSANGSSKQESSQMFTDVSMPLESPRVMEIVNTRPSHRASTAEAPFASVHAPPRPNLVDEYTRLLEEIVNNSTRQTRGGSTTEIVQFGPSDRSMTILRRVGEWRIVSVDPWMSSFARPEDDDDVDYLSDIIDIDDMTYEELVNLEQIIGNANPGLTYDSIHANLQLYRIEPHCVPKEEEICSICLDKYEAEHVVGVLDCGHGFHRLCIRDWLVLRNSCPICRAKGLDA